MCNHPKLEPFSFEAKKEMHYGYIIFQQQFNYFWEADSGGHLTDKAKELLMNERMYANVETWTMLKNNLWLWKYLSCCSFPWFNECCCMHYGTFWFQGQVVQNSPHVIDWSCNLVLSLKVEFVKIRQLCAKIFNIVTYIGLFFAGILHI